MIYKHIFYLLRLLTGTLSSLASVCLLEDQLQTKAFQCGDNQIFLSMKMRHNTVSLLEGVSFDLMTGQPTENARNARLLLDRRPCSTYWLPVGKARGDNVQDEFPHNRNKTFMTYQQGQK